MDRDAKPTETIGQRVRRLRRERGLSQRELASEGVSFTYVSRIEADKRQPSVKALRLLASKLGVSPEYLETGRDLGASGDRELRLTDAELELRLHGETDEAAVRAVLEEAEEAGDAAAAARARVTLALAAARSGAHEDAVELLEDVVARERPAVAERPDLYAVLGRSYAALGETPKAAALFSRCVDELRAAETPDTVLSVRFAGYLSSALVDVGDSAGAYKVLADALKQADGIRDRYTLIRIYWGLGRFHAVEGPPARALEYVRRAIALLEATEDRLHLAQAHHLCATILLDQATGEPAREHLDVAEELLGSDVESSELGSLRTERARLALQLDDPSSARTLALEALDLLERSEPVEVGRAWRTLAAVFERLGDLDLAERAYATAVEALTRQGAPRHLAEAYRAWGKFLRGLGREEEALDVFERAADLAVHTVPTAQPRAPEWLAETS